MGTEDLLKKVIFLSFIVKVGDFGKKHFRGILVGLDIVVAFIAMVVATFLKFDALVRLPEWFTKYFLIIGAIDIVLTFILYAIKKIYNRMWQYFVAWDYAILVGAFSVAKMIVVAVCPFIYLNREHSIRGFLTWMALYAIIELLLMVVYRGGIFAFYRFWTVKVIGQENLHEGHKKRVMIIGAGHAARRLIEELRGTKNNARYKIVALIDDNAKKHNEYLDGVKVCGGRESIVSLASELDIDEIFFAVPSAGERNKKEILDICNKTGCVLKTLPDITDMAKGEDITSKLRKVDYTDLLGRDQIKPDLTRVFSLLEDQTVFISGGGGSIGSELVRQVAASGVAKRIIIFDIAENGAYDIQQEIRRRYPQVDLKVLIGSVRDEKRLSEIFEEYRPSFVYHAAAHKHVPLMEDSPKEAVKNNVFGTYNLAKVADKYGVKRFVMISTDKAVNPTNVMGATKRICEMIVQSFNKISETDFVAVRFGNVLGSNGSVIPLFKEQIENGGPVTVTHPDIIRYFMLIPEAVSLVLQAGAYAQGGEIFILDMGSPVKIRELAENLIRLSGHVPGEDIEIKYTGLRDGEKLYEELLISEEGIQKTQNDLIYVARPMEFDSEHLFKRLSDVKEIIETADAVEIVDVIKELVPTFIPNNEAYNKDMKKEKEEATV